MDLMERVESVLDQLGTTVLKLRFTKADQGDFLKDLIDSLPYVGTPMPVLMVLEKHAKGGRKAVAQEMMRRLNAGQNLSDAMAGWFDPMLIYAMRVGEKEGVLVATLEPVLKTFTKNTANLKQALSYFTYPVVLTVFVVFLLLNLKHELFPIVLELANNDVERFPVQLQTLWYLANGVVQYGWMLIVALGLFFWGFRGLLHSDVAAFKPWRTQWPIFKHYAQLQGATFMRMYATLKRIHVLEMDVVHMAMDHATPFHHAHLERYQRRLTEGHDNMADVFDTGLLSSEMVDRLRLLSGSERYVDALEVAAAKIVATTQKQINILAKVLAGIWLVGVGIVVLIAFSGMFSISQLQAL